MSGERVHGLYSYSLLEQLLAKSRLYLLSFEMKKNIIICSLLSRGGSVSSERSKNYNFSSNCWYSLHSLWQSVSLKYPTGQKEPSGEVEGGGRSQYKQSIGKYSFRHFAFQTKIIRVSISWFSTLVFSAEYFVYLCDLSIFKLTLYS